MATLGSAFPGHGLVASIGQLMVRSIVQRDLGPAALGQFQAAWAIGMTYMTFVLGAMATDYYPDSRGAFTIKRPRPPCK